MKLEEWNGVTVEGREVVKAERTETPLSGTGRGGGIVYYQKVAGLVFTDGGTAYGCLWDACTYIADNPTSIASGHWKVHEVKPDLKRVPYADWTLAEILGRLTDAEADLRVAVNARDRAVNAGKESAQTIRDLRTQVKDLEKELAGIKNTFRALTGDK